MCSKYKVIVLFDGYSNLTENGMNANCTCTLVTGPQNIIIDTMTAWDADKIIKALLEYNLTPDEINWVICSHGHSDHIGNNNLFLKAKHVVGYSISHKEFYFDHDFSDGSTYIIDDYIKILPTPGHTLQDVSVIVNTVDEECVAIVGDLFEREEDIKNEKLWKEIAGSDAPDKQIVNRRKIVELADYIVPGHGPKFKVTTEIKKSFDIPN